VGATLNQFLVSAAIEKANAVFEQERVINLSAESAKIVFDLMENPPEPNKYLKRAMQPHLDNFKLTTKKITTNASVGNTRDVTFVPGGVVFVSSESREICLSATSRLVNPS